MGHLVQFPCCGLQVPLNRNKKKFAKNSQTFKSQLKKFNQLNCWPRIDHAMLDVRKGKLGLTDESANWCSNNDVLGVEEDGILEGNLADVLR